MWLFVHTYLSTVFVLEIEDEISNLNCSKASAPFISIPISVLKLLKFHLSFPLEIFYNASFSHGLVADQLKIANVIPDDKIAVYLAC